MIRILDGKDGTGRRMAKKKIPLWRQKMEYVLFRFFYDLFRRLPLSAAQKIAADVPAAEGRAGDRAGAL